MAIEISINTPKGNVAGSISFRPLADGLGGAEASIAVDFEKGPAATLYAMLGAPKTFTATIPFAANLEMETKLLEAVEQLRAARMQ